MSAFDFFNKHFNESKTLFLDYQRKLNASLDTREQFMLTIKHVLTDRGRDLACEIIRDIRIFKSRVKHLAKKLLETADNVIMVRAAFISSDIYADYKADKVMTEFLNWRFARDEMIDNINLAMVKWIDYDHEIHALM